MPDTDADPAVRTVTVDHRDLRVAVGGHGRPLLMIMGIGGNLDMWAPFDGAVRRFGVQTIAYDAPGTGGSQAYPFPKRMHDLATTAEHLLDALGYDQVDVLGVSFGGGIAQQLARQAPQRVAKLVLAATMCGLGGVPGDPRVLLAMATPRRFLDRDYFRRVAGDLYGGRARQDPEGLLGGSAARFDRPPSLPGYLSQLYAVPGWSSLPWLHRLTQPTLVLAGDDDPLVPAVNGRILAARIPGARLHVVKGGGHLFLLEEADEVAALVGQFLTGRETPR